MELNLGKVVVDYLATHPEQKFSARQIAEWIFDTYPAECQEKRSNSWDDYIKTDADLVQQLVAEISSQRPRLQKRNPELKTTEGRPRKYYYSTMSDVAEVAAVESVVATQAADTSGKWHGEHALYPLLSLYLWEEFGVYSKRIDEKRSSNKRGPNGNRWLYPDVVGMEDLGADWHQEVRDCVNQYSDKRTKLWSFEAKLLINRSNVRECFFQAVNKAIDTLVPIIVKADVEPKLRQRWLERLWQALQDDEMPYIELLGDYWGELCVTPELASHWADEFLPVVESVWSPKMDSSKAPALAWHPCAWRAATRNCWRCSTRRRSSGGTIGAGV